MTNEKLMKLEKSLESVRKLSSYAWKFLPWIMMLSGILLMLIFGLLFSFSLIGVESETFDIVTSAIFFIGGTTNLVLGYFIRKRSKMAVHLAFYLALLNVCSNAGKDMSVFTFNLIIALMLWALVMEFGIRKKIDKLSGRKNE